MHHGEGSPRFAKEAKHQAHRAAHFFVRVKDDPAFLVVAKTDRQGETQLAFLGLVELAALEARVQKVQFGLGHCALQPEQQSVVEVRRIVATVFVDHQGCGESTQFQQPMPIEVRARQPRDFQGKHRTHLPHRNIRHQGLEVLPPRHLGTRLPQVPIECVDQGFAPAQFQRLLSQGILALRALLMVAYLTRRRLA